MAKPTTAIRGFIQLNIHQANNTEVLINLQNISMVRPVNNFAAIQVLNSPFTRTTQELTTAESYEEVLRRIKESS